MRTDGVPLDQLLPPDQAPPRRPAHVKISPTSLPPLVEGDVKGELSVCVSNLEWASARGAPRAAQLRVKWWGEAGEGTAVPLHAGRGGAGAAFPVACGPKLLIRYLRDAGSLALALEECPSGRQVGALSLPLAAAHAAAPLAASLPVLGARGQALGRADVVLQVRYSGALSSFEMNEHLASTERGLPLYPPTAAGGAAAAPAPAAAGARGGARPPQAGGQRRGGGGEGGAAGTQPQQPPPPPQQQQQPERPAPAVAAAPAAASGDQQAAPAEAPAAAAAACARAPDHDGDALADIIAKAERLKAAMDEALAQGLGAALGLGAEGGAPAPAAGGLGLGELAETGAGGGAAAESSPAWRGGAGEEPLWSRLLQAAAGLPRAAPPGAAAAPASPARGGAASPGLSSGSSGGGCSGSSSSSGLSDLDEMEEIEDLILRELLFPQGRRGKRRRRGGEPAGAAPGAPPEGGGGREAVEEGPAGVAAAAAAEQPPEQGQPQQRAAAPGPPLIVTLLGARGVLGDGGAPARGLSARVRAGAGAGGGAAAAEARLPWGQREDGSAGGGGGLVEVEVEGPACLLHEARLATERPVLAVELWGAPGGAEGSGSGGGARRLLGIARVPLDAAGGAAAGGGGGGPLEVGGERLLASGSFAVWDLLCGRANGSLQLAVTLLPPPPARPPPPPAAEAPEVPREPEAQQQGGLLQEQQVQEQPARAAGTPPPPPPPLVGVLHRFDVTVHSASGLPGPAALRAAGEAAPESRFAGYCFPGDPEALYTGLVLCGGGEDGGGGDGGAAVFGASACHTILLPPGAGVAEHLSGGGDPAAAPPLVFQVYDKWEDDSDSLAASCQLPLRDIAALAAVDGPSGPDCAAAARAFLLPLALEPGSGEARAAAAAAAEGACAPRAALLQVRVSYSAAGCYVDQGGGGEQHGGGGAGGDREDGSAGSGGGPTAAPGSPGGSLQGPAGSPAPPGEICVEIIRACGLQAAVKEAQAWLGGGSALLGHAHQVGPQPYATLDLGLPGQEKLQTPFQVQTFCPQFHFRAALPLTLDAATLAALASAEARVELWHHTPRSQAVAAALAGGLPAAAGGAAAARGAFLGGGSLPLAPLLTRPQGVSGAWLLLKSQRGEPVGAAQVSVRFTHLGGRPHDGSPDAPSPLESHPEWLPLLPPPAAALARAALGGAGAAPLLDGRMARCSVYFESVLLPAGEADALGRPTACQYAASYQLPGSHAARATAPAPAAPAGALGAPRAPGAPRTWAVPLRHCGVFWAAAGVQLARALLLFPLSISVTRQEPVAGGARGGGGAAAAPAVVDVPVGSAELDLSPLLAPRPGAREPATRWLSSTLALVHPVAKNLGGCRVSVKVLLELAPPEPPPPGLGPGSDAFWDTPPGPGGAPASPPGSPFKRPGAEQEGLPRAEGAPSGPPSPPRPPPRPESPADSAAAAADGEGYQLLRGSLGAASARSLAGAAGGGPPLSPEPSQPYPQQLRRPLLPAGSGGGGDGGSSAGGSPGSPAARWLPVRLSEEEFRGNAAAAGAAPPARRVQAVVSCAAAPGSPPEGPAHPAAQLQQQREQLGCAQQQREGGMVDVRLGVERALNLQLQEPPEGCVPGCYVRCEWPGGGPAECSPLVAAAHGPLGAAWSAQWLHSRLLALPEEWCWRRPGGAAGGAGGGPPLLLVQLWVRPLAAPAAAALPPLRAAPPAAPAPGDALAGCAAVDLSPLAAMGSLDGWYHLVDYYRQIIGQIRVEVTPAAPPTGGRPSPARAPPPASPPRAPPSPEAAAAAAGWAAGVGGLGGGAGLAAHRGAAAGAAPVAASSEALMTALRANLEELDQLSARLVRKLAGSLPPSPEPSPAKALPAGAEQPQAQQEQAAAARRQQVEAELERRRRAAALAVLRTCSDDGGDLPVVGGASASSAGTDDIIGNVDFTLGDASEDDMAIYGTVVMHAPQPPAGGAAAPPRPSMFEAQDWMFDIRLEREAGGGADTGFASGTAPGRAAGRARGERARRRERRRAAFGSGSSSGSDSNGEALGVPRVAHAGPSGSGSSGGGGARFWFANTLPPPQENFPLDYSDAPWVTAAAPAGADAAEAAPGRAPMGGAAAAGAAGEREPAGAAPAGSPPPALVLAGAGDAGHFVKPAELSLHAFRV
ncbi:MAG: hypothetical protein J3K34DRAFT_516995 [Monoraphidium minutum]|nr:MAG: hypothetical protein J3K34DRAFT_516995 [Monoraphidium minutum]